MYLGVTVARKCGSSAEYHAKRLGLVVDLCIANTREAQFASFQNLGNFGLWRLVLGSTSNRKSLSNTY